MSEADTQTDTFDSGIGILSAAATPAFDDDAPWTVNGVAMPVNTVVNGGQNVDHFFPAEVLRDAAEKLIGKKIVKNFHDLEGQAAADEVIGEVTDAAFQKGVGLVFEGEIADRDIANKIKHGYLDVSPSLARSLGEIDESLGARRAERIADFRDLGVVAQGQPGADIQMGSNPAVTALQLDALSRAFDPEPDTYKSVAGVEFDGTAEGELDESDIPSEGFEDHYLYPGETKGDSSYPVVDADGQLRRGNVDAAHQLGCRGRCDDPDAHDDRLRALAAAFENPPEWATETDTNSAEANGSDDGAGGGKPQSTDGSADAQPTNQQTTTMSDNELNDNEQALLAAVDDPEAAIEVLSEHDSREEPTIVEQSELETLRTNLDELAGVFREALQEMKGLKDETVEALSYDALAAEFRDEEGDISPDVLAQNFETGDTTGDETPDGGNGTEPDTLSDEDRERIETIQAKEALLRDRAPQRWETLKAEAADLAGVDDYGDIELEAY